MATGSWYFHENKHFHVRNVHTVTHFLHIFIIYLFVDVLEFCCAQDNLGLKKVLAPGNGRLCVLPA
jgi:hypothetical protein